MVSARRFRQAFIGQWNYELDHNKRAILRAYRTNTEWTAYMLQGEDAFLKRIARDMELSAKTDWYHLDLIYYDAETDLLPDKEKTYPTHLPVYIEHENGGFPEQEMYKLLMWPAALKVLIFYDLPASAQESNRDRQQWLANKLTQMFEMGREVDLQRPGISKAEYLLLIGQRQEQIPTWRYLCVQDGCWPEQPNTPQALL